MFIKELVLHNFGVYASTNIFRFSENKPIVLIGGMNGRGKTTFLEAVLLALYGSNSFAYSESQYKSFGQYLKSYVNISDGTMRTYIEMEFSMDSSSIETYRVHREWTGDRRRTTEDIKVYKNGQFNSFLTENWNMFIENILPSGLANFFFFDGEKIAELAVEKTSSQMKESIKTLLGISILDNLESDLGRIINREKKNLSLCSNEDEINALREKKDYAVKKLNTIDSDLNKLSESKSLLEHELEKKKQEYSSKGGDVVNKRQDLLYKRTLLSSKIEMLSEQLRGDAASELPLVLVESLLVNIRKNAESEQEKKVAAATVLKMRQLLKDYVSTREQDEEVVNSFVQFIENKFTVTTDAVPCRLSDTSLLKLQVLLDGQLNSIRNAILSRKEELKKVYNEAEEIDNYLSVDIDEKAVSKIFRQIKEIEQKIIENDVKYQRKEEERKIAHGEEMAASIDFNRAVEKYLKYAEVADDSERTVRYSHMAITILDAYKIKLQKNKIDSVAATVTECYKKLANKRNLIDKIKMDPVTLELTYLNSEGKEVNKASLSAGEKQLMVISLLWALALCSQKKLPVIIDTPLSRLDSAHRLSLINNYFPMASEQTIILSTDSEIDRKYYEIMKKNIGDEYTLIYDDSSKSTSIHRGYFLEEQK